MKNQAALLSGIAGIITALAALFAVFTSDAGDKADKADTKTEAGFDLVKQKFTYVDRDIANWREFMLQQNDRINQLTEAVAEMRAALEYLSERAEEPSNRRTPSRAPASYGGRGGGTGAGAGSGAGSLSSSAGILDDLAGDEPAPPPIQKQLALPENLEDIIRK